VKFFIGLFLGVGIAAAVTFYLNNKTSLIFLNKDMVNSTTVNQTKANLSAPLILAPGTQMRQASSDVITHDNASATVKYDFYDVLDGKKALNSSTESKPVQVEKSVVFFVQAGAFVDQDSANDMKARLTLLDFDTKIVSMQEGGKMINKILLGPYKSATKAKEIQERLKEQGIGAIIVY
jgi:cell division protein FtsN